MNEEQDEVEKIVHEYLEQTKTTIKLVGLSALMIGGLGIFMFGYWLYQIWLNVSLAKGVLLGLAVSIGLIIIAIAMWRNEKRAMKKTKELLEKYVKQKECNE